MKLTIVAALGGLAAGMALAAVAPESAVKLPVETAPRPVETLVRELTDERYKVREEATRQLWAVGSKALPELEEAAAGDDPEQVFRAKELIRKIKMDITPDTDPAIVALVEQFATASTNKKSAIYNQLQRHRAWRQILKLYASETDTELQAQLQRGVSELAILAARESIAEGKPESAREYLEMAPADAGGLLALADFHRSHGTWDAEMQRALTLEGKRGAAWRLALYRAAGNLTAARDEAAAAGENLIFASLSALLGDPLPWLQTNDNTSNGGKVPPLYSALAIKRWNGEPLGASDLEQLAADIGGLDPQAETIDTLFQLGERTLAEEGLRKRSPREAFLYFESLEAIPEALEVLGLEPQNPDYRSWVAERFARMAGEVDEDERERSQDAPELLMLAGFLETRGLGEIAVEAYVPPLMEIAKDDPAQFLGFLTGLFGSHLSNQTRTFASPELARAVGAHWAGDDAQRWLDVVDAAFGSQDGIVPLWDWLAELDATTTPAERFDGMLALLGSARDPQKLREAWMKRVWQAVDAAPADQQVSILERIEMLLSFRPDASASLKLWEMLPAEKREERSFQDFTAVGKWQEAADFHLALIGKFAEARTPPRPELHAAAAAYLRKAGKLKEAAAQDAIVEKLALGHSGWEIGHFYLRGEDFDRAAAWWSRAACQADPASQDFMKSLPILGQAMLDNGHWLEAAAIAEVRAQCDAAVDAMGRDDMGSPAILRLGIRLQADLGHALALLKTDRPRAIAMLANCLEMFPSDGSLADDFFPALRKVGLLKEHDQWFEKSWARLSSVVAQFPQADNALNTAAWLAARAQRRLDEAARLETSALAARPNQPAYLDTMGEIEFAKGHRAKALEWSNKAVNFKPVSFELRQQLQRFRTAPLPR